ncbi:MAG: ribose-phosphate diphosphokinase [bacterium]
MIGVPFDGLIACSSAQSTGLHLAKRLNVPLLPAHVKPHPDGELAIRITPDVKGKRIVLVGSFYRPVHNNIFEFALIADALARADVKEIIGVIPYMAYARQDRVDQPGKPLSMAVIARMLRQNLISHILTVELHNPESVKLFDVPFDNINGSSVVSEYLRETLLPAAHRPILLSPDKGRANWVAKIGEDLQVKFAHMVKNRLSDRDVEMVCDTDLTDHDVFLLDDMIATGGSMAKAVQIAREQGAASVHCVAVHGVFAENAETRLITAGAESIAVSTSIPSGFAVIDLIPTLVEELLATVGE